MHFPEGPQVFRVFQLLLNQAVHVSDESRVSVTHGRRVDTLVASFGQELSLGHDDLLQGLEVDAVNLFFAAERSRADSDVQPAQVLDHHLGDWGVAKDDLQHVMHKAKFGDCVRIGRVGGNA